MKTKLNSQKIKNELAFFALLFFAMICPALADKSGSLDMLAPALKKGAPLTPKMGVATQVMKGDQAVGIRCEFMESETDYPSVLLPAPSKGWDLTPYAALEAEIENIGSEETLVCLAIENFGGSRNNQSGIKLVPGQIGFLRLEFGFSWGKPADKPDLKSIDAVFFFLAPKQKGTFVIKSLRAVKN